MTLNSNVIIHTRRPLDIVERNQWAINKAAEVLPETIIHVHTFNYDNRLTISFAVKGEVKGLVLEDVSNGQVTGLLSKENPEQVLMDSIKAVVGLDYVER